MIKPFTFLDLKKRPYELLGIMALLMFLVSFVDSNSALDINMHDTYFVIAHAHICWFFSGVLLFLWSMGVLFRRYIWSITLSWVQVILTLISVIAFLKIVVMGVSLSGVPRRYYAFTEFEQQKSWFSTTSVYVFMLLLIVLGQLIFIINVITGFLRKVLRSGLSNQQETI
jgi:cytochrome c oxidase subunit 1